MRDDSEPLGRAARTALAERFYSRYKALRQRIFAHLLARAAVPSGTSHDPTGVAQLPYRSQKLLDRVLILRFCEDAGILPAGLVRDTLERGRAARSGGSQAIWHSLRALFRTLEQDPVDPQFDGLSHPIFTTDEGLNALQIDDAILEDLEMLIEHDPMSPIDITILGHLFEQSISDIERMTSEAQGKRLIPGTSRRKRQGIYYTPDYVSHYIAAQTLGRWLEDRRLALGFHALPPLSGHALSARGAHLAFWRRYQEALREIRMLDPACGAGAFLCQAFDLLIEEHRRISAHITGLGGEASDEAAVRRHIVRYNLFGVDLSAEAVEIARLSLWLRAGGGHQPWLSLERNLCQGNALIASTRIAGPSAFRWEERFGDILKTGGFDIVIGNPPYTYRNAIRPAEKAYFKASYRTLEGNFDLYRLFMERIVDLVKSGGYASFIVPGTFLTAPTYRKLRAFYLERMALLELFDLGLGIFGDVVVESVIFVARAGRADGPTRIRIQRDRNRSLHDIQREYEVQLHETLGPDMELRIYLDAQSRQLISKIESESEPLSSACQVAVGINTGYIKASMVADRQVDASYHRMLGGSDVGRHHIAWKGTWIRYDPAFVKRFGERGRSLPPEHIFQMPKILVQRTRRNMKRKLNCYLDGEAYYNLNRIANVVLLDGIDRAYDLRYVYAVLSSRMMDFYFDRMFNEYEVKPVHLRRLPIQRPSLDVQAQIGSMIDEMLERYRSLQEMRSAFPTYLAARWEVRQTGRIRHFYRYPFTELLRALAKQGRVLENRTAYRPFRISGILTPPSRRAVSPLPRVGRGEKDDGSDAPFPSGRSDVSEGGQGVRICDCDDAPGRNSDAAGMPFGSLDPETQLELSGRFELERDACLEQIRRIQALDAQIERGVCEIYGLSAEDMEAIRKLHPVEEDADGARLAD